MDSILTEDKSLAGLQLLLDLGMIMISNGIGKGCQVGAYLSHVVCIGNHSSLAEAG